MKAINVKLKETRLQKGYSQEELADVAGVNIRTIQRIEKGDNEPRGKTLQLLCEALNIEIEQVTATQSDKETSNNIIKSIYISILLGVVFPLGNILGPLLLWQLHKKKGDLVFGVGRHVVYNQIVFSILAYGFLILGVLSKINGGNGDFLLLMFFFLGAINYGYAVYSYFRVCDKHLYYPLFKTIV